MAAFDKGGECFDIGKMFAQVLLLAVQSETEMFLHHQAQFQRIDGIQSQPFVAEQRVFAADVGGGYILQSQTVDNQLLDLVFQVVHMVFLVK